MKVICDLFVKVADKIDSVVLARAEIEALKKEVSRKQGIIESLNDKVNDLSYSVQFKNSCINALKGALLRAEKRSKSFTSELDPDDLRKLINLCHPDKHGGKSVAAEMTQKLLELKNRK